MPCNSSKDPEVLKTWLLNHFEKPYPSPAEKAELAKQSGYSKKQVSGTYLYSAVIIIHRSVNGLHQMFFHPD